MVIFHQIYMLILYDLLALGLWYFSMLNFFVSMQVQCGDVELERKIDEKIDQFIDRVEKHPNKKNQVY